MATRVHESGPIAAPVDKVWSLVRPLDFSFLPTVANSIVEGNENPSKVGSVRRVSYKDGTVQLLKITEINDATRSVTWDVIMSEPPVPYTSAVHTLRLRRVTVGGQTVVELISDYSNDASLEVIEDSRYKKLELIKALRAAIVGKPRQASLADFVRRAEEAERLIEELSARMERLEHHGVSEAKGDGYLVQVTGAVFSGKANAFIRNSQEFSEVLKRVPGVVYYTASFVTETKFIVNILFRDSQSIVDFVARPERKLNLESGAVVDGGPRAVVFGNPSRAARDALKVYNASYYEHRGFSRA